MENGSKAHDGNKMMLVDAIGVLRLLSEKGSMTQRIKDLTIIQ
jgi:hypothetical protein